MRGCKLAFMAFATTALALPALAQDDDDAPPPTALAQQNDDAKFIAYNQPAIVFTHAEIIDGTGAAPKYDQTLVVENGRITAIGPSPSASALPGVTFIDATGKTLMPGFVMAHEHLFYIMGRGNYASMLYSFPRLYLAGGTTTARTGGSMSPYGDINLKLAIDRGDAIGPDLDVTGPYLNGPGLPVLKMHVLTGPDDATKTVNYWADEGATSFKAYTNITRAELKAAIEAAHARGLKITGHLCSVTYREAAELGIDNLEHGFGVMTDFIPEKQPDACPPHSQTRLADLDANSAGVKSLIDLLVKKHVTLTSTLTVFETFTAGRPEAPEGARALLIPELRKYYEDHWKDAQTNDGGKAYAKILPMMMALEKRFVAAGGNLISGTDPTGFGGVVPGYSAKREVELLVEAGFPFPEALKIATLNGAKFLGRDRDVGSLETGKRADINFVEGDPMRDPSAIDRMPLVFKAGIGYRADAIIESLKGQVGLY
jgi:imidazolonepropionase-like amidohydrolase